jgi:hypothetical protein
VFSDQVPGFDPAENQHRIKPMPKKNITYPEKERTEVRNFIIERQGLLTIIFVVVVVVVL